MVLPVTHFYNTEKRLTRLLHIYCTGIYLWQYDHSKARVSLTNRTCCWTVVWLYATQTAAGFRLDQMPFLDTDTAWMFLLDICSRVPRIPRLTHYLVPLNFQSHVLCLTVLSVSVFRTSHSPRLSLFVSFFQFHSFKDRFKNAENKTRMCLLCLMF